MTVWDELSRPEKALARARALEAIGRCQSALFLPAAQCLCVRLAYRQGIIDGDSHVLAVERHPGIARSMRRNLARLPIQTTIHRGRLHTVRLRRPLDLAFIDLNGVLDRETAIWTQSHLAPNLMKGAVVIFTFAKSWRNNQFIPRCHEYLLSEAKSFVHEICDELYCDDLDFAATMAMFRLLFAGWQFKIEFRLSYQDHDSVAMTLYRLYDFKVCKISDKLAPILEHWRTIMRSAAAQKAWETRRKNGWVHPSRRAEMDGWKKISWDDIPSRDVLRRETLSLLAKGVDDSDRMRDSIRQKRKLILSTPSGSWNSSPTDKFVNEHAWVLHELVSNGVIERVRSKTYRLVG